MCDILCVTNRKLCTDNFSERIKRISESRVSGIILREKDLSYEEYKSLFDILPKEKLIIHSHTLLPCERIQLSMSDFVKYGRGNFKRAGVSVHSVTEAEKAEYLGADYLIAGHIFKTDCKKDVPPRGISFLSEICNSVKIPVYAIGGITPENAKKAVKAGALGVCLMSAFMTTDDPERLAERICLNTH